MQLHWYLRTAGYQANKLKERNSVRIVGTGYLAMASVIVGSLVRKPAKVALV